MRPFAYVRATSVENAIDLVRSANGGRFLGGGTNLIDLMKMGVETPGQLVDVSRVAMSAVEERPDGIRIGATARNSDVAAHPLVLKSYRLLSEALLSGASPQIRNMATIAGNLLQRTRCYYFYDPSYEECNKRGPGSGCAAIGGYNRIHAILGASDRCIATHPSDMAVALTALDARVVVKSAGGERVIPIAAFYRLPGDTPHLETELGEGELISSVNIPAPPAGERSCYLKLRDRNSFAFALVSVAALIDMGPDHKIREARIALGGVAPKPWRVRSAEDALRGQTVSEDTCRGAAEIMLAGAEPHRYNGFKVELARRAIVRALQTAAGQDNHA